MDFMLRRTLAGVVQRRGVATCLLPIPFSLSGVSLAAPASRNLYSTYPS